MKRTTQQTDLCYAVTRLRQNILHQTFATRSAPLIMATLALLTGVVAELESKARGHAALKTFLQLIATTGTNGTKPPLNLATATPPAALGAFVFALFERRWGSSEHISTLGAPATALSLSASVAKPDSLTPVVDALLRFVRMQPPSAAFIDALRFVAERTDKPYVRDQAFRFFFEWLRTHLDAEPTANGCDENAVAAVTVDDDDDDDDDFDAPCDERSCAVGNFSSSMLAMIEAGLTDVWSAIRKMCAKKLNSVVASLGMNNVRIVFCVCVRVEMVT